MSDTATPFQCAVSADLVRRALFVASSDRTRFYLQGVHVSPHPERGAYVVATNGVALVCFHDEKAQINGEAILCPDETFRRALEDQLGDRKPRLLFARRDRLVVAAIDHDDADTALEVPNPLVLAAQFQGCIIDGKYPDWRKIIFPITPAVPAPQVDARQLNLIGKALSTNGRIRHLNLCAADKAPKQTAWAFGSIKNGFGLIAGSTDEKISTERPDWLLLPEATPAEAAA